MKKTGIKLLKFGLYALILFVVSSGISSIISKLITTSNERKFKTKENSEVDEVFDAAVPIEKDITKYEDILNFRIIFPENFTVFDKSGTELSGFLSLINSDKDEIGFAYSKKKFSNYSSTDEFINSFLLELLPNIKSTTNKNPIVTESILEENFKDNLYFLIYNKRVLYNKNVVNIFGFDSPNYWFYIYSNSEVQNEQEFKNVIKKIIQNLEPKRKKELEKESELIIKLILIENHISELKKSFNSQKEVKLKSVNFDNKADVLTLKIKWLNLNENMFNKDDWEDFNVRAKKKQILAYKNMESLSTLRKTVLDYNLKLEYILFSENDKEVSKFKITSNELK